MADMVVDRQPLRSAASASKPAGISASQWDIICNQVASTFCHFDNIYTSNVAE